MRFACFLRSRCAQPGAQPVQLIPILRTCRLSRVSATAFAACLQISHAQQYNFSLRGYQPLLQWAEEHVAVMHAAPPSAAHQTLITNGGNHTLEVRKSAECSRRASCQALKSCASPSQTVLLYSLPSVCLQFVNFNLCADDCGPVHGSRRLHAAGGIYLPSNDGWVFAGWWFWWSGWQEWLEMRQWGAMGGMWQWGCKA